MALSTSILVTIIPMGSLARDTILYRYVKYTGNRNMADISVKTQNSN